MRWQTSLKARRLLNMPATQFICPNQDRIPINQCLSLCPHHIRCMGKPTLEAVATSVKDRGLGNIYSVTELISGTREVYLKKTTDYAVDPQDQIFAMHGTAVHSICEKHSSSFTLTEVRLSNDIYTGQIDAYGDLLGNGKKIILLYASISYLGGNGQHPIFKKRMQLPTWYKDFCIKYCHSEYEIKFVGLYHYQGMVIFTEFVKDTYLKRKMNNSAAHVYINDLYQGIKNGVFSKIDNNGNTIKTIAYSYFKNFLDEVENLENNLFELFRKFNYSGL